MSHLQEPHRYMVLQLWRWNFLNGLHKTQLKTFLVYTNCLEVLQGVNSCATSLHFTSTMAATLFAVLPTHRDIRTLSQAAPHLLHSIYKDTDQTHLYFHSICKSLFLVAIVLKFLHVFLSTQTG